MMNRLGVRVLALGVIVGASGLSACAVSGVSSETTALNTAALQFKSVATAASPIPAAEAALAQARMLQAATGGSIQPLTDTCGERVKTLQAKFNDDVTKSQPVATLDADYAALIAAPACGVPAAPDAAPMKVDPLITDLEAYFAALQALATAKDAAAFGTAADSLATSITSFAKAAGGNATEQAASAVFSKLAQSALQDAEYKAMKLYVSDMDPLLAQAAPAIISALRAQQSYYISVVTNDANEGADILNKLYQNPTVIKDPSIALAVYAASAQIESELQSEQVSVRTDPATAVAALVNAHHALYEALQANNGQFSAIVSSLTNIATSAESLISTPSTPAKSQGK
jgi:hypothetical protein